MIKITNKLKYNISILNKSKLLKFSDKKIVKKILDIILADNDIQSKIKFSIDDIRSIGIDFVFCEDHKIHEINKEYRGIDAPTDVISFALFADCEDALYGEQIDLGEIIISLETAKKQAQGSYEDEIYTLISHGILHLLGFDHQNVMDYNFIVNKQNQILEEIKNDKIQIK